MIKKKKNGGITGFPCNSSKLISDMFELPISN